MSFDLITFGDVFVDLHISPLKSVFLKGDIEGSADSRRFKCSTANVLGGRVGHRRFNFTVERFTRHAGGSANNAAVAGCRLVGRCGIICRIGRDADGDFLEGEFRRFGVDTSNVRRDMKQGTGLNILLISENGARASVACLGSNANLSGGDANLEYIKRSKVFLMTNYYLLPKMLGSPTAALLEKVKNLGILTALDPGPVPLFYGDEEVSSILDCWEYVDILLPTIDEARAITGLESPKLVSREMLEYGARNVIIKMGEDGCLVAGKEGVAVIPPYRVGKVTNTIGAGDLFAAALLISFAANNDLRQSTEFANAAAALFLRNKARMVTQDRKAYPTKPEVESFLLRSKTQICHPSKQT